LLKLRGPTDTDRPWEPACASGKNMSAKRSKRSPGKHNSGYIKRYKKLLANGKNKGVVVTAIGRELLGFIWAIGIKVEAAQKESLQRAA
jgi:hypothetical protein